MNWIWIDEDAALAIHDRQLAEHGGSAGVRDRGLLLSALARAQNAEIYDPVADAATLAASYGYGIARNHPFIDGNKRTAFVVLATFLSLNDFYFSTSNPAGVVLTMLAVADGSISEDDFAGWIRENSEKRGKVKGTVKKKPAAAKKRKTLRKKKV